MIIQNKTVGIFIKVIILVFVFIVNIFGQNDDCLTCHEDESLSLERNGREISLFVNESNYAASIHGDMECTDCHEDFDPDAEPHKEGSNISKVICSNCHEIDGFSSSSHSKNLDCFNCHSKHEIQPVDSIKNADVDFCITCHNNQATKIYTNSVHYKKFLAGENSPSCITCHGETAHDVISLRNTHDELHFACAKCHEGEVKKFEKSLHGQALAKRKFLAPDCIKCHGSHNILSAQDENSLVYKMNIPALCGDCHKDGTKVSEQETMSQRHILKNYSQSIHGDGLFNKGLLVTAVCTDCHFTHDILPHEDPSSSINRKNIASTCTKCHALIEKVHKKVIKGELWEKQPHIIPSCVDCHQPHEIRNVFYEEDFTNKLCMSCHEKDDIYKVENGVKKSLKIDLSEHNSSVHKESSCVKCHTDVSVSRNPICLNSGKVDCSNCHPEVAEKYALSTHSLVRMNGNASAPECVDCHGTHKIKNKKDASSPTFSRNIPALCGQCHGEGKAAEDTYTGDQHEIVKNYSMSIHGKGLLESGLIVTATCVDCHSSHMELPASDPLSAVNHDNIAVTCAKCHYGIYEQFEESIHSPKITKTDKELPSCRDCHQSHTIHRVDEVSFRQEIIDQCGRCHLDVTETYFDTFHGKVSKLGSAATAKCYDCHGSHGILPSFNPNSKLSRGNVIETCKSCHPNSNRKFVGYLTHATHHDKDKYPFLYYTFWAMTILLLSTFTFFGLHTLLWLPRALAEKRKHKKGTKS